MRFCKRLLSLVFVLLAVLMLTACGKSADVIDIEGEWYVTGFYAEGMDPETSGMLDDVNDLYVSGTAVQTTTYRNGKYTMKTEIFGSKSTVQGTYVLDGNRLTVYTDDGEQRSLVTVEDGMMTSESVDENWKPSGAGVHYQRSK